MKKILFTILLLFSFITITYADGLSVSASCPSTAKAGEVVSCDIIFTPTTSWPACAVEAHFSITGATYESFTNGSNLSGDSSATGAVLSASTCFSSAKSIGVLKVKMPSSGNASIAFSGLNITDDAGDNMASSSNFNKTIRILSSVNTLSSITVSGGTLSPAFSTNTTSYTATVNSDSTTITVSKTDSSSSVSGDGTKTLSYGNNTFNIVVTAEDGSTKTYILTISRPDNRDTNNKLSSITLSDGTLSPNFTSETMTYTAKVNANVSKVTINAIKSSAKASFVNGYGSREVNLSYGENKVLVKVISENEVERIYSIFITRADDRSNNNYLKSLSIDKGTIGFKKDTLEYAITVNYNVDKATIIAAVEDKTALIAGTGEKTLEVGKNEFEIVVTAENTSKKTYKVTVTRLSENETPSSNANLKELKILGYDTLSFNSAKQEYEINLKDGDTSLDLTYLVDDATSVVSVDGNKNLKNGSVVTLKVTSTDGTVKEYKIKIIKASDSDGLTTSNTSHNFTWKTLLGIIGLLAIITIVIIAIVVYSKRNKNKKEETLN